MGLMTERGHHNQVAAILALYRQFQNGALLSIHEIAHNPSILELAMSVHLDRKISMRCGEIIGKKFAGSIKYHTCW
jgi:hypothetical protein